MNCFLFGGYCWFNAAHQVFQILIVNGETRMDEIIPTYVVTHFRRCWVNHRGWAISGGFVDFRKFNSITCPLPLASDIINPLFKRINLQKAR